MQKSLLTCADLTDGFVDEALDFIRIGVALPDVLDGAPEHAPADGFLDEFREIALFHALRSQEGAQGEIGVFRDLDVPADGDTLRQINTLTPIHYCRSDSAPSSCNAPISQEESFRATCAAVLQSSGGKRNLSLN
jgi:hypothetical protein